ncbi:hypothetical protein KC19_11G127000 [Ceratodon purpureus]|uniref:Uncharacterized protein n=1 Tax=Ceratodon purpureus TaxID=3225 RepID=A0A8T0GEF5_CERPU|nr:hypothetical protein KC19_11G127000 [Ceratodon purpureus]
MAGVPSYAHFRASGLQKVSAIGAIRPSSQTRRFSEDRDFVFDESVHKFSTRSSLNLDVASVGTSQRHGLSLVLRRSTESKFSATRTAANRHQNHADVVTCRASSHVDKYGQCKCIEDAVISIMKDTIQHCLHKENDMMRGKVLDQMGKGLAALCRVSVGVAAESSIAPIPIKSMVPELSTIRDEDLEQIRRMLHLTSLPFSSTEDEDFKRLMKMLQKTGDGKDGSKRTLTESELSQITERLGSDMVQCVGPVVMCFSELPLWAKHRAMLLPAEVAGKVALSLLTGPK